MNFSSKNPEKFPVEVPLVKKLLIRLMTRNEADTTKAWSDRQALAKNMESLNMSPEAHLIYIMSAMEKMTISGALPTFETGLFFGVAMTLSARSANGKKMLNQMLGDIEKQQDKQMTDDEKAEAFKNLIDAVPDELVEDQALSLGETLSNN